MIENGILGKKIIFLYPPPVLTEVVENLVQREFEVYLISNHTRLKHILAKQPDALVFINIDDGDLDEKGWETYVRSIKDDEKTSSVGVGLLTLNGNKDLSGKYLMEIGARCGFIVLKIGAAKTIEILTKTLDANEARGRRKFVRAVCAPGTAQAFIDHEGRTFRASVSEFSAAGLALSFEDGQSFKTGMLLPDLQLSIKGTRILTRGVVVAQRQSSTSATNVVMFDPASLDDAKRQKLRTLVFRINQAAMERLLETG